MKSVCPLQNPRLAGCLLLVAGVLLPAVVSAQAVRITVVEAEGGTPVRAVQVSLLPEDGSRVLTEALAPEGTVTLSAREAGDYRLRATALGFLQVTTEPVRLERGRLAIVELRLGVDAIPLDPLTITSRVWEPFFMQDIRERQRMGFGELHTREDFEARPGAQIADILRGAMGVGVSLPPDPESVEVGVTTNRGLGIMRGPCWAALYIDGHRLIDSSLYLFSDDPERDPREVVMRLEPVREFLETSVGEIEAIEIYRGAASVPGEFSGSTAECGVVAAWTRRHIEVDPFGEPVALAYRVRTSVGLGREEHRGHFQPRPGLALSASGHWTLWRDLAVGGRVHVGRSALEPESFDGLMSGIPFLTDPRYSDLSLASLALEGRWHPLEHWPVGPVLHLRLLISRRSFTLEPGGGLSSLPLAALGFGQGWGLGLRIPLRGPLGLEAGLHQDRIRFDPYRDLRESTRATWTRTGFELRLTYDAVPEG